MITTQASCQTERHTFGMGEGGAFFQRDVRELGESLSDYAGKVQMVYLDPPFFTGQQFYMAQRVGEAGWQGKSAVQHLPLYQDKYSSRGAYLAMVGAAIDAARHLLHPTGCIYLHCDYRMNAYLRLLMDQKLGEECFINEIIWHYHTGGRARDTFSRKHDTILLYGMGKDTYFNREAVASPRGKAPRNHMKRSVDAQGRVSYSIMSNGRLYTYREDDPVYPDDVWENIPHLQQRDPERTGYDTQKPMALLNRMILASSRQGDRVADLFAGSGTTAAAATALGRGWLAVDQSPLSLACHRRRLSGTPMTLTGSQGQDGCRVLCEETGGGYTVRGELDEAVEWFAGGFYVDGVFQVESISGRSQRSPALTDRLSIGWGENPGAMVADAQGNRTFYTFTQEVAQPCRTEHSEP